MPRGQIFVFCDMDFSFSFCSILRPLRAFGLDIHGVQTHAAGHEEAVFLLSAKAEVGTHFGQVNFANEVAVGRENFDAVIFGIAPARAAPQVAVHVAANAIGESGRHVGEDATVFEAAICHIKSANMRGAAQSMRGAGIGDVENFFVGRETQAVGTHKIVGNDGGISGIGIEAIDVGGQFVFRNVAFVVERDTVSRIGEPDTAIGMCGDVIGCVERFALKAVDEHGDGAVVFGAGDAPRAVFTGNQPTCSVAGMTIAIIGRLAIDAEAAIDLAPAHDAIIGYVAEEHTTRISKPHRAFAPAQASTEPLDRGVANGVFFKARVQNFNGGIGIGNGTAVPRTGFPIGHFFSLVLMDALTRGIRRKKREC